MSDEFTDVQGVSIGDWNHVHGINDIDPSSGKKKRRCENCRPNRGYVCGRCKANNAGMVYEKRRVSGYDRAPMPNFNTESTATCAPAPAPITTSTEPTAPMSEEAKKSAEEEERDRLAKKEARLARRAARKKHIDAVFQEIRE